MQAARSLARIRSSAARILALTSRRAAIVVEAVRTRGREVLRQFGGMNAAVTEICAGYSDAELELVADFLHRTAEAGRGAAAELAQEHKSTGKRN
jgi:hypothetical protein